MRPQFNREIFELLAGPFIEWPTLQCPYCRVMALEPDNFIYTEDIQSTSERMDVDWDPSRIHGFFHGIIRCPRSQCFRAHAIGGLWRLEWGAEEIHELDLDESTCQRICEVRFTVPSLPLASLPSRVPSSVVELISVASAVILSDPSSAANRIRSAIEATLDDQGIVAEPNLHGRIRKFRSLNPTAADHLLAVKYIGNLGSHEFTSLPLSFVLDGIEIFLFALEVIYGDHVRRAAQINQLGKELRSTHKFS